MKFNKNSWRAAVSDSGRVGEGRSVLAREYLSTYIPSSVVPPTAAHALKRAVSSPRSFLRRLTLSSRLWVLINLMCKNKRQCCSTLSDIVIFLYTFFSSSCIFSSTSFKSLSTSAFYKPKHNKTK